MVTKIRVKFTESSKAVTSETLYESDTMAEEEILNKAKELAYKAQEFSASMTLRKNR